MKGEYRRLIQLSTVEQTLEKAGEVLSLAQIHTEEANLLSACASIMLAASLEQGTRAVLEGAAARYAVENEVDISQTPYSAVRHESLRRRMVLTPQLLSDGKFRLRTRNKYVEALHDLISLRNELVHI